MTHKNAEPVGYANIHQLNNPKNDGVVLRRKDDDGFFTVPLYTHPQPAELSEVSGDSGELSESASIVDLLDVIAPFAHFALVRSALGNTAPNGGTVYSVCTSLGDAEITAEDFENAFNAFARYTEAK